jgi:DNA polymerase III subunit beta
MQFTINRGSLLKVLRTISGVVERRQQSQLPILSNILLQIVDNKLLVIATDQEMELTAVAEVVDVSSNGKITIPFRTLYDICKALPDNVCLAIKEEGSKIRLTAGSSRFSLSSLPAEQFPRVEVQSASTEFSVPAQDFKKLIERTAFAMADQDVRYFLNGMLLEKKNQILCAVAADGHRLAKQEVSLQDETQTSMRIILPRKGVLEILRIIDDSSENLLISISSNHLKVSKQGMLFTARLLEGKFPDYNSVIPQNGDKIVLGHRERLKEAFFRASVLFSEKLRIVKLRLSDGCLKILANNAEQDEVEEDISVDYQGQELEIGFNVRYLIDFFSVVQSEQVKLIFSDPNSSVFLQGVDEESGGYVLMPLRI